VNTLLDELATSKKYGELKRLGKLTPKKEKERKGK
jgi:hypothetical protein